VKHNKVVHEQNVLLTLATEDVPFVGDEDRVTLKPLGHGFFRVVAHHGFMDLPDVPKLLRKVRSAALPIDLERTSYFLGRERLIPSGRSGMARWREWLFSVMSQNAQSATTFFHIPPGQVVELGAQVEL
jgi:KUP system potassium uptake protein